ncbi:hypothetical protein PGQ11_008064 [Apiospora arundinis]|uniref:Uncharacterized protein n=1 Tax=Apiospora arundinis TaxID=335852 RepID=A0ABR2IEB8_9PEZI
MLLLSILQLSAPRSQLLSASLFGEGQGSWELGAEKVLEPTNSDPEQMLPVQSTLYDGFVPRGTPVVLSCLSAAAISRSTLACRSAVLWDEVSGRSDRAVTGSPPPFLVDMYEPTLSLDMGFSGEDVALSVTIVWEDEEVAALIFMR